MSEPAPLQPVNRTYVHVHGKTLSFFGGCDYFRFASHPRILAAVTTGLRRYGLNIAASRKTTGNHELYLRLERDLAQFFGTQAALFVSNGYVTSLTAAQALAGQVSHALLDERAHVALQDAARMLDCPVLKLTHRNPKALTQTLRRCGKGARPIVLTDGLFAHDGSVAPLAEYQKLLGREGCLLVDDAHGAGTLGRSGQGTPEVCGAKRTRLIQCVTLSKAFGVYGGAILCDRELRTRMMERSQIFIGNTPLPLPLAYAARTALQLVRQNAARRQLQANAQRVRDRLRAAGFAVPDAPGPIIPLHFAQARPARQLHRALLAARILPPLIKYPGGPANGYFRFVISSEHTPRQLEALVTVLQPFVKWATATPAS